MFRPRRIIHDPVTLCQYIPLQLAWAITVHKSQGQTLDNIYVYKNINYIYDNSHGKFYVCLSRVKSLKGLNFIFYTGVTRGKFSKYKTNKNNLSRNIKCDIFNEWCDYKIDRFYKIIEEFYQKTDERHINSSFTIPQELLT